MFINYYLRHIQQLVDGVKEYVDLRQRSLRLSVVEKLTILLSSAVVAVLGVVLGLVAFFFLSIAGAFWLAPHVGGMAASLAIMSAVYVLLMLLVVLLRKPLIVNPLTRFLAHLMIQPETEEEDDDDDEEYE